MPVVWRWGAWDLCFALGVFVILLHISFPTYITRRIKLLGWAFFTLLFIRIVLPFIFVQWKEERAAATEGDLLGRAAQVFTDGLQRAFPDVSIGDKIWWMSPNGNDGTFAQFYPDADFKVSWGKRGPLVDTTVRERSGNLVLEIVKNHWRVYPQYIADKNYTEDALEIRDSAGHIIVQIKLGRNSGYQTVELQGEFWNGQGQGWRIMKAPIADVFGKHGAMKIPLSPTDAKLEFLIKPIFQYPSKDHWGELLP